MHNNATPFLYFFHFYHFAPKHTCIYAYILQYSQYYPILYPFPMFLFTPLGNFYPIGPFKICISPMNLLILFSCMRIFLLFVMHKKMQRSLPLHGLILDCYKVKPWGSNSFTLWTSQPPRPSIHTTSIWGLKSWSTWRQMPQG